MNRKALKNSEPLFRPSNWNASLTGSPDNSRKQSPVEASGLAIGSRPNGSWPNKWESVAPPFERRSNNWNCSGCWNPPRREDNCEISEEQEISAPYQIVLGEDIHKVLELTEVRALRKHGPQGGLQKDRTEDELKRIGACLREMERDLEKGQVRADLDLKFHTEIAAAAHNTIFLHLMQTIHH